MKTQEFRLNCEDYSRTIWFIPGPTEVRHPLCVFLDGEHYLNGISAPLVLKELNSRGTLPPMSYVFVSHNGAESRHRDLFCNDSYSAFIAKDLVSWSKEHLNTFDSGGNVICGVSLSGLAGAYVAVSFPDVFSAALSQSGSFWWKQKYFSDWVSQRDPIKTRFWLSVGDEETGTGEVHPPSNILQDVNQVEGVLAAGRALRKKGARVRYHLYKGGHEFEPWTRELGDALQWLVGLPEERSSGIHNLPLTQ